MSVSILGPENTIVFKRLTKLLQDIPKNNCSAFEEIISEFGQCHYQILYKEDGSLKLSFQLPELEQQFKRQLLSRKAIENVGLFFKGVAKLSTAIEKGFHVSLDIDINLLLRLTPSQQKLWAKSFSSIRLLLIGQPLRYYFSALASGSLPACSSSIPPHTQMFSSQPGQRYGIQPATDGQSVTIHLPIRFTTRQEAVFGSVLLKEFARPPEASGLSQAPQYLYTPPSPASSLSSLSPPSSSSLSMTRQAGESESSPQGDAGIDGGVVSLELLRRHVAGPQLENIVWTMSTFPQLVNYQLSETKTSVRSLMRSSATRMSTRLAAAAAARGRLSLLTTDISSITDA
uniref:Arp2/3 complex 34 kDa subunit n=1 Tax=Polytomella parva TaxID=51329 RepID=A0A7S0Y8B3_9CHLO|mmetsp:Transcript_13431/g.23782  ORF Transcript_13431/g.23782 Transcript_13431/m.23782 type:complete len:344 (+) Transcript_13431:63-1094(+)|eukprot:CAMPEP_0175061248 /NCGR_PEP_ID=MMETSP0052_2-20121109/13479_1 /TAXON_ID=51329 ORGANISM="Polytomella parva, Strain SAG 63-3" /NCGR_SAMPLE_ID=MMETSP0052_2 /ASSEMBLY_ACC=CAM_ASM_000194 /LENGTH=343 /DNA_ID=CAMNT_0016327081 /DNA_START=50 /DNA_END=1077 /DNA_ORIENTATION=-